MFKTQQDIWKHLADGNVVINIHNNTRYRMINGKLIQYTTSIQSTSMNTFSNVSDYEDYQEPKWYENLGKGVLCLFEDGVLLIVEYDTDIDKLLSSENNYYELDEVFPATEEQVKKYIFRGEING